MLNVIYESTAVDTTINDIPSELINSARHCDPTVLPVLLTKHNIRTAVDLPWSNIASNVGLIVIGNAYPKQYTQKVIQELQSTKRVSPLNFINASDQFIIYTTYTAERQLNNRTTIWKPGKI